MEQYIYYFQYKQVGNQRGLVGRLSEVEMNPLLPRVVEVVTPGIYPPGSIVWHAGALTSEEIDRCQWMTFLVRIDRLDGAEGTFKQEMLRQDYDAFCAFLESAKHQPILTLDKDWVAAVAPQAFDYQSPARQSPYLIRALINLTDYGHPIGRVLDPMGGYGQTLFECVLRGVDGGTLEISPTASQRSADNLRQLLKRLRIPFEESRKVDRFLFVTQTSPVRTYQIINGDTRRANQYLPDQQFDSLITDFPYGVRTGSRTEKLVPTGYDELLDAALPSWKRLLTPHGAIAMAYNRQALPRETVLNAIQRHGFRQRFADVDLSLRISDKIYRDIVAFERA